jgi:hypothetical protein
MRLHGFQIPVATSLLQLARTTNEPFQEFICYWIAFNNIYAVVADNMGIKPRIITDNGKPKFRDIHGIEMATVKAPQELAQITDETRHRLIAHNATRFFVHRTPRWRGRKLKLDAKGQQLNGVLNVSRTVNADYPRWSPIEMALYEAYMAQSASPQARETLAKQIVDVLYAVRCNLVHGSKSAGDENDAEVVCQALPLLKIIGDSFLMPEEVEEDEEEY